MSKRMGWEYSLQVKGVVGRMRKPTTHHFTLIETDTTEQIPVSVLESLIARKMIEIAYKYGAIAIIEYPTKLEDQVSHRGKAVKSKVVEITKGQVVFRTPGYNLPNKDK